MDNLKLRRTLTKRNINSGKSSLSIGGSIILTNNIPSKFSIENDLDIENRNNFEMKPFENAQHAVLYPLPL